MEENHSKQDTLFNLSKKINLTMENVFAFLYGFSHDTAGIIDTAQGQIIVCSCAFYMFRSFCNLQRKEVIL